MFRIVVIGSLSESGTVDVGALVLILNCVLFRFMTVSYVDSDIECTCWLCTSDKESSNGSLF